MPKWTTDQEKAIYAKWRNPEKTKSANILVNAAAGSGKTAVLVERIINKLCAPKDSPDRCYADNLLVVTFTNAAAKEMQQRIYDSLAKKQAQAEEENNINQAEHLKKQLSLIHSADITTIDAFCLKTVKSYFHLLNISPDFKIADTAECEMLKDEAMEELFEKYYSDKEFIDLLCLFSNGRDDNELAEVIREIFDFTRSQPDPQKWLFEKAELLITENEKNPYFSIVKAEISNNAHIASSIYKSALELMINTVIGDFHNRSQDEFEAVIKKNPPECENDLHFSFGILYKICYNEYFLAKSLQESSWDMSKKLLSSFKFERTNAAIKPRDKEREIKDPQILEQIKSKRTAAKDILKDSILPLLSNSTAEIQNISHEYIYPMIKSLVKFCNLFEDIYLAKKESKNLREFSDIEHLCLKLFCDYPEARKEMQDKYVEILMDEYQDSNALQEAIFEKISRGDNLFTVGDMKQSIYRFRSSDPDLFKNKCNSYSKEETAHDRKIVLSKNFRSRAEVLDGINSVFEKAMSETVGGVEYDNDQRLHCGDTQYENKNPDKCGENKCECYVIISDDTSADNDDEALSSTVCEARFIAKKIREMYDTQYQIRDKRKKIIINSLGQAEAVDEFFYRPVRFGDFAIIMSSYKNSATIFQKELSDCGIDCYAQTGGYFDRPEIKLATALLKMINNPYNDIPLIAVLRSPIFSFSDDELCQIRMAGDKSFYDAVKTTSAKKGELSKKCDLFLEKLNKWRYMSKLLPVDMLIWQLYEDSSLYSFAEAVYGADAATNLRLLFTRAKTYENSGYKGLFNFIRFIGKMKKRETDLSSAVMVSENSDVVRLMTIHKSKGLEFPVVFLAGASKKFNRSDTSGKVILHKELGFGADYINFEKSFYMQSIEKKALTIKLKQDMLSEEMRKLYVAMTRAKEKLIITAVSKPSLNNEFSTPMPKKQTIWQNSIGDDNKIKKTMATSADSFIDWIAPVAMSDNENWIYSVIPYNEATKLYNSANISKSECASSNADNPIRINSYLYSKNSLNALPVKLSVTDLKSAFLTDNITPLISSPDFLVGKKGLTGAQKGTAIHYVMQKFIPFHGMTISDVSALISQLQENGELSAEKAAAVNPNYIIDFYNTDLGKRIMKSNKVVREAPFEIEISASSVYNSCGNEKILLQGIIDCYFYEGGEIVIVDYKSDYYTDIDDIKEKYKEQLEYYKLAIEKICKKTVKNTYLYLFSTGSVVSY